MRRSGSTIGHRRSAISGSCPPRRDRLSPSVHMAQSATRYVRRWGAALAMMFSGLTLAGCSERLAAPSPAPTGDQAPVGLRNLQIATVQGHRAVLMRLSRLPTLVRYSDSRKPARIIVQAWGPPGDSDLPERDVSQFDALISQVRVSRRDGELRVTLDLNGDEPPPYSVHEMGDWIMVRFAAES